MSVSFKRAGSMRRVIREAKKVSLENIRSAERNATAFATRANAARGKGVSVNKGNVITAGGVVTYV